MLPGIRIHKTTLIKHTILVSLISVASSAFGQTTYYVSSAGNDSNNGRSTASPFRSIDRVNNLTLQAGDSVLFRRGDTLRGAMSIRQSGSADKPIVFEAYGTGSKPVLAGSESVSNWTSIGGNVWRAPCPSCGNSVTGLYRNGVSLPLGRYPNLDGPNKGNLTINAHTDKYQIFSREHLPDNIDWKGAEIVMRPTAWILDKAIVDHQYGDALNIFYNSTYNIRDNSEYFFQNHPGTLDRNGEWYYDSANKNMLIYSDQGSPNGQAFTATVYREGINIANASYISIGNLHITQTLNTSLFARDVSNLALTNLDVTESGEDGVIILGAGQNIRMENSRIITAYNNGFWVDPYQNVTLRGNKIQSIGIVPGRGKSGDGQYNGVTLFANQNVLFENNVVDSVGYNGVLFSNNTTIRQNVISNYCLTKIDGGGIYAWNGNKNPMNNIHILSNILYTGPVGSSSWVDYSIGIFLDDCVEKVDIRDNTIFGNTQWGVFLHGATNITFTGNTLFDNRTCQLVVYHNGGFCPIRNDIIKHNVIVSKEASQLVAQFESNANDLNQYGQIDSNYYARPFDETATIQGVINSTQFGRYELKDWQTFSNGLDLHSRSSPITYVQYKNEGAGGINRINSTFEDNADGWGVLYSRYNNAEAVQDGTGKLDGSSLRVGFATPSNQSGSYAQIVRNFGTITKGKTYVLRFDAIATASVNVLTYLRTSGPPFTEYDRRYTADIGQTRKSYEFLFTATEDGTDAVVMLQIDGEGATFWIDNVRLQEGVPIRNNPDDFIKLFYNPTLKDSVITLNANYRDVKNKLYSSSFTLKPFTSVVLLKEILPPSPIADLSLSLISAKRLLKLNEPASISLRISNQSDTQAGLTRWTCRLPANLQFVSNVGQPYTDNVMTGMVSQLYPLADTTFTFLVKPTMNGLYQLSAQITTANSPDPDSTPNSGTADGEDDADLVELRVENSTSSVFRSPNPNQRSLPAVASNQPIPDSTKADLSLRMEVSSSAPAVGAVITYTIRVANAGGRAADGVYVLDQLPTGLQLVNATNWTVSGQSLSTMLAPILANSTASVSFTVKVMSPGMWLNKAQINASNVPDPDSTPGNGFLNGEDDQDQIDIRTSF